MMIGTYGLAAKVIPYYTNGVGTNSFVEYNADANYSYMMNDNNMLMAMVKYTHDSMKLGASQSQGWASNASNNLDSVMMMGMWTYKQTYNLSVGWNYMKGSSDMTLYNGAGAYDVTSGNNGVNPITGSANGSPNTNSFLFQADYVPFGKGTFAADPYLNLRFSVQYWAYTQFNGASTNYDGAGRNAAGNNTLYFVGNMMF
jgi:hypothetical protein